MAQFLEDPTQPIAEATELTWARDVMFVYANLSTRVHKEDVTPSRYSLHRWASDEKNMEKFLSTMVPKATDMLQKARSKDAGTDEAEKLEHRAISELQALLDAAVAASSDP